MYVHDGLQASRSKDELKEGLLDLRNSLERHGFELKHLIFNFETIHEDIKDEQSIFHLKYNLSEDLIGVKLNLNLFPKNRGVPKGQDLIQMKSLDNLKLTKTVASRLVGQIFDLIGHVTILRSSFLILFSKVCTVAKNWTDEISRDTEVYQEFMSLLLEVKNTLTLIRPFPRCKVPEGNHITDFIVHSDASMHLVAFTTHIQVKMEMRCNLTC